MYDFFSALVGRRASTCAPFTCDFVPVAVCREAAAAAYAYLSDDALASLMSGDDILRHDDVCAGPEAGIFNLARSLAARLCECQRSFH